MEAGGLIPRAMVPTGAPGSLLPPPEPVPPKRQAVVDRLRRRLENYRRRHNDCIPRFDQTFSGVCEQQNLETSALQKRFLESKAKRAQKKGGERKQHDLPAMAANVHVQQKFLKRPGDDSSSDAAFDGPAVKLQCSQQQQQQSQQQQMQQTEALTKFSVEIVQQLEFTTSAANSQPQQISTNVTVKALTSTKTEPPSSDQQQQQQNQHQQQTQQQQNQQQQQQQQQQNQQQLLQQCKQEPLTSPASADGCVGSNSVAGGDEDDEFVDLEQCAAALEKDAANGAVGGAGFPRFDIYSGDQPMTSETFDDLISEISDLHPEFIRGFDFPEQPSPQQRLEDEKPSPAMLMQQQQQNSGGRTPNFHMDFPKPELSPAAQTLKHMAEQHQHKNNQYSRGPYAADFGQYQQQNQAQQQVKQELLFPQQPKQQQQYSPYGSPGSLSGHGGAGSPGYPPPPRPPSSSASSTANTPPAAAGGGQNTGAGASATQQATLQIKQAQQLHISQQGHHNLQVSAGQQLHLSGDLKSNVSVAAQQGMFFSQSGGSPIVVGGPNTPGSAGSGSNSAGGAGVPQQSQQQSGDSYTVSQSQTINFTQQTLRQRQQQHHGAGAGHPGMQQGAGMGPNATGSHMGMGPQGMAAGGAGNPMGPHGPNSMQMHPQGGPSMTQANMAMAREQHAKLLQQQHQHQQQILRAQQAAAMQQSLQQQQQQQVHMQQQQQVQVGARPPPPDYKATGGAGVQQQQLLHQQMMQQRFQGSMRRAQPIPPSGPMMRPQHVYMSGGVQQQQQTAAGMHAARMSYHPQQQRAPNAQVTADGLALGAGHPQQQNEWRHVMSQQQSAAFHTTNRFHPQQQVNPGGFSMPGAQGGPMQMTPGQMQHHQQQQMMRAHQMNAMNNDPQQQNHLHHHQQQQQLQQMLSQQNQQQQLNSGMSHQMASMSSVHMSQTQSMTMNGQGGSNSNMSGFGGSPGNNGAPDFSLEFLDGLPTGDSSNFSAAELLNSLDTDPFNLQDIL